MIVIKREYNLEVASTEGDFGRTKPKRLTFSKILLRQANCEH
jgi:hypothetical protein